MQVEAKVFNKVIPLGPLSFSLEIDGHNLKNTPAGIEQVTESGDAQMHAGNQTYACLISSAKKEILVIE